MGNKLLIVASKGYGNYVKEIAESMGCFDEISFVDNDRLDAIGKLEEIDKFSPEYGYAIAACDDGTERLEWNKRLEASYNIPVLIHKDSTVSPSAGLQVGFIGDGCTLKSGTIVESTSMIPMGTETKQGTVLFVEE